jgi:hypothetical protein
MFTTPPATPTTGALQPPNRDSLAAGRDALDRGAWDEARAHLTASVGERESPEALEDLGLAAWWLDEPALTFDSRERAYALYREGHDARGAARVAIWLVWDYLAFRGDFAVASGWLERARRLLVGKHDVPEYGWLMIREAEVALFRRHDPSAAITRRSSVASWQIRGSSSPRSDSRDWRGSARVTSSVGCGDSTKPASPRQPAK